MGSVRDVAQYILSKIGKTTTWKLQKLVYYTQAWHLVWDDEPLFDEEIQAWANGPVCPDLYNIHKGNFFISSVRGADYNRLRDNERETIDIVVDHYGKNTGQELSSLTHSERPWQEARKGLIPGEMGDKPITHDSLSEYYGSL